MAAVKDLWGIVWGQPYIDPAELPKAIEDQVRRNDLDYRSRLLIRDSLNGLQSVWGPERLRSWITGSPVGEIIQGIWKDSFEREGFHGLERRIMEPTRPETIEQQARRRR